MYDLPPKPSASPLDDTPLKSIWLDRFDRFTSILWRFTLAVAVLVFLYTLWKYNKVVDLMFCQILDYPVNLDTCTVFPDVLIGDYLANPLICQFQYACQMYWYTVQETFKASGACQILREHWLGK